MKLLGFNIDHIATLRQARLEKFPNPVELALVAEQSGADSIVAHLREDRRHIQDRDIKLLRQAIKTKLNLEMALTDEMVNIACDVIPDMVCIVPERRKELTTEGGLNLIALLESTSTIIQISRLQKLNIEVSFFIEADAEQIRAAVDLGANSIEFHTGIYANYLDKKQQIKEVKNLEKMSFLAKNLGLIVKVGHGLDYYNVREIAKITEIVELNIGFSIIARSLLVGIVQATREMKALINK